MEKTMRKHGLGVWSGYFDNKVSMFCAAEHIIRRVFFGTLGVPGWEAASCHTETKKRKSVTSVFLFLSDKT